MIQIKPFISDIYLRLLMYRCNMDMHMEQPVNQGCYIGTGDADYIRSHVLSQARSTNYRGFSFCYFCPVKIYEQQCTWALFNRDVMNVFTGRRSSLVWSYCDAPVLFLEITALGFKVRIDALSSVLHYLCLMDFLDLPLVQHLLTIWQPAWQLVLFPIYFFKER